MTAPWECVSLVHGFFAHPLMMTVLGHRLDSRGYLTRPWGYWNMRRSILEHAEAFSRELARLDADRAALSTAATAPSGTAALKSVADVSPNATLVTHLTDGKIWSRVERISTDAPST